MTSSTWRTIINLVIYVVSFPKLIKSSNQDNSAMCDIASSFRSTLAEFGWICHGNTKICNGSSSHWIGVQCKHDRVVSVSLPRNSKALGTISPSIGQLSMLSSLSIQNSLIGGLIPSSIGKLLNLNSLLLTSNYFSGSIPTTLGNITSLSCINMSSNKLKGEIPYSLWSLSLLKYFDASYNQLTGQLPTVIGKLSSLTRLNICYNRLGGVLPTEIGELTELVSLQISSNFFSGALPSTMVTLVNLISLHIGSNKLAGNVPSSISLLTNLQFVDLSFNVFSGCIPTALCQLSDGLTTLIMSNNRFSGPIPLCFGLLSSLQVLLLSLNKLTGTIPSFLRLMPNLTSLSLGTNKLVGTISPTLFCPLYKLRSLQLDNNPLSGIIPSSIGNLSSLTYLSLCIGGGFTGTIPSSIGFLTGLATLIVRCQLTGTIPSSLGLLSNLVTVDFFGNSFTGTVPSSFEWLTGVQKLNLGGNCLSGILPSPAPSALYVTLSANRFAGPIPNAFCQLSVGLVMLDISRNYVSGTMPSCLGSFQQLTRLDFSSNRLTGPIPTAIGNVASLQQLYLNVNRLSGGIPSTIGLLKNLQQINLNGNLLSKSIPAAISAAHSLAEVYLSSNRLTGPVGNLFNRTSKFNYRIIDVSDNLLTGRLPGDAFVSNAVYLALFAATVNCLEVYLPQEVCAASNLQVLALDGISTAAKCRETYLTASGSYALSHLVRQSIPNCLLTLSQLATLHLSGNNFIGALPSNLSLGANLVNLDLSHNRLHGSIPEVFQQSTWSRLDLSYNMLSGSLPYHLNLTSDGFFASKINRLSGIVPSSVLHADRVNVLEGNLFQCDFDSRRLPTSDPNWASFRCGSDAFQLSVYMWMVALLALVAFFLRGRKTYLPGALSYMFFKYDSKFSEVACSLRGLCILISVFILLFLMPSYSVLSSYYGTHVDAYAWVVSVAYLSGKTSAIVVLLCVSALIVCVLCYHSKVIIRARTIISAKSAGDSCDHNVEIRQRRSAIALSLLCGVLFLNVGIVFAANAAYVYGTLSASRNVVFLAQVLMGLFKTVWREYFVRKINFFHREFFTADREVPAFSVYFLTAILILNNIILPSLAEAAVDSNCVYNILVTPPPVRVAYEFVSCNIYSLGTHLCMSSSVLSNSVSYVPPFTYRYQCSSTILSNYSSVFVYMFLLIAINGPCMSALSRVRSTFQDTKWLYNLISLALEDYYQDPPTFDASFYIAEMLSHIAILLTFGAAFPPLGFIICVAVCLDLAYALNHLRIHSPSVIHSVPKLDTNLTLYLVPLVAIFFSFFLFDILGDQETVWGSLWAPATLILVSINVMVMCVALLAIPVKYMQQTCDCHFANCFTYSPKVQVEGMMVVVTSEPKYNDSVAEVHINL